MSRIRNLVADLLVGLVVILVAFWMLRGLFGFVGWLLRLLVVIAVIIGVLVVASRIRAGD